MPKWYAPAYERDGKLVVSEDDATRDLGYALDVVELFNRSLHKDRSDYFVAVVERPVWKKLDPTTTK